MPARRMRQNRLPVAPPPLRHRVHSPSSAPRESSLDRVRRLAREHRQTERPFEPTRRGTWQGSSRDLVVNPARARRGDRQAEKPFEPTRRGTWQGSSRDLVVNPSHRKGPRSHHDPDDADFLVIEEEKNDRHPLVVVNPTDYDGFRNPVIFAFSFGAYGHTRLIVWGQADHLEDALVLASEWLTEHAPGILTTFEEEGTIVYDYMQEHPDMGEETAQQEAMADFTYTEAGWIPSWEWNVSELTDGELFDVTLQASKEEYEREYGGEESGLAHSKNGHMTTFRITCRNNSDARNFQLLGDLADARHNGGKLVIARVEDEDVPEVKRLLDDSYMVASYETAP